LLFKNKNKKNKNKNPTFSTFSLDREALEKSSFLQAKLFGLILLQVHPGLTLQECLDHPTSSSDEKIYREIAGKPFGRKETSLFKTRLMNQAPTLTGLKSKLTELLSSLEKKNLVSSKDGYLVLPQLPCLFPL